MITSAHSLARETEVWYQKKLVMTDEDRKTRNKICQRVYAQVVRNVVLVTKQASNRKWPLLKESYSSKKKKKK